MELSRMVKRVRRIQEACRDFFFPSGCWGCGEPLEPSALDAHQLGMLFCEACLSTLEEADGVVCAVCGQIGVEEACWCRRCGGTLQGIRRASVGARYMGVVRDLVLRLKFGRQKSAAWPLACLALYGAYRAMDASPAEAVVAVPLHPIRMRERGFNQAALIASHVAKEMDLPLLKGVVRRVRNTRPQGTGGGGSRKENVEQAFSPLPDRLGPLLRGDLPGQAVRGCHVLLVDDVISTGATLAACGQALLDAGALTVIGAAAAT